MNDVNDQRMSDYLDDLDRLERLNRIAYWPVDNTGFPMSYDEWNAIRVLAGKPAGDFAEYLSALNQQEKS